MRSYEAARSLFSFLGICSWVVIAIGVVVALGGLSAASSFGRNAGMLQALAGATPGVILAMLGFFGLALVQMGRANVDTAEYGQQSLGVARQQLEISNQVLAQNKQMAASYARQTAPKTAAPATEPAEQSGATYSEKKLASPSKETAVKAISEKSAPASLPDPKGEPAIAQLTADTFMVLGRELVFKEDRYHFGSLKFHTLEQAEAYFGQMGVNQNANQQST
ncbi:hypothetical protein [uncultured Roseobacter sp.]|uniref:hypothetical protein n=1 Tax=uncultured Roseobacter sp. TaxID=114847 RepID=UPI00263A0BAE|nr:hypothetical protein [uncultured Roseobacter sp.]